jgi:hypothetical protein
VGTPHQERIGALMGGPIAERAELTDSNPPRLEKHDRWGRNVSQVVVMPPTFEASRRELVEQSFSSPAFREQARQAVVDPSPLAGAWGYLLDQAESDTMCLRYMAARSARYGSERSTRAARKR